jgi:hypothetical protein
VLLLAKKKKKEKKEKRHELKEEKDEMPEYSLDSAFHSAKTTETTLQRLLKGVSEGDGFAIPKREADVKITPQLSHESKSKIAEAYVLEDVPLVQRTHDKKKPRATLGPETMEKAKTIKTPVEARPPTESELKEGLPIPSTKMEPSFIKKGNIYYKLTEFFEGLLSSYSENYDRWEMSISNILGILRKMRKITKKNTDDLVGSINNIYEKIQGNLEQFKVKRDEIEKVAEVDIESMSGEFRRVLGLLELQVKEYQLKRVTDEFIHAIKYFK